MTFGLVRVVFAGLHAGEHHVVFVLAPGRAAETWGTLRTPLAAPVLLDVRPADVHMDPDAVAVAWRQACFAGTVGHPAIAPVRSFGVTDDSARWMRLEPLVGRTLSARLEEGPLPAETARVLGDRLSHAIETARGLGHRHGALTMDQVFLPDDDPGRAVILGFGLSRLLPGARAQVAPAARAAASARSHTAHRPFARLALESTLHRPLLRRNP